MEVGGGNAVAVVSGVIAGTAAGTREGVGTTCARPTWPGVVVAEIDKVGGVATAPVPVSNPESGWSVSPGLAPPAWFGSPGAGGEAAPAQPAPTTNIEIKAAMYANFRISSYRPGNLGSSQRQNGVNGKNLTQATSHGK